MKQIEWQSLYQVVRMWAILSEMQKDLDTYFPEQTLYYPPGVR